MSDRELKKDEYLDVSENVRHWQNLRLAQLTVFIIVTGALIAAIFQAQTPPPAPIWLMLQLAGILIVIVFWVSDERAGKYWLNCVQRAETLEKELGFEQYSPPTQAGLFASSRGAIVTVGNALRLLFTVLFLFWGSLVISTLTEVV